MSIGVIVKCLIYLGVSQEMLSIHIDKSKKTIYKLIEMLIYFIVCYIINIWLIGLNSISIILSVVELISFYIGSKVALLIVRVIDSSITINKAFSYFICLCCTLSLAYNEIMIICRCYMLLIK